MSPHFRITFDNVNSRSYGGPACGMRHSQVTRSSPCRVPSPPGCPPRYRPRPEDVRRGAGACSPRSAWPSACTSLAAVSTSPAAAAVGDDVIAWVEVEDGVISGGPGLQLRRPRQLLRHRLLHVPRDRDDVDDDRDRARSPGRTRSTSATPPGRSAPTRTSPARWACSPTAVPASRCSYPMTSFENWEDWEFAPCRRDPQPGRQHDRRSSATAASTSAASTSTRSRSAGPPPTRARRRRASAGYARLFDGTFESFDGWRKAGAGGFGRQTDCTIRGFRGRGATWFTEQQAEPYTLELDWRRSGRRRRLERLPRVEQPRRRRPGRRLPGPHRRRHRRDRAHRRHRAARRRRGRGGRAEAARPVEPLHHPAHRLATRASSSTGPWSTRSPAPAPRRPASSASRTAAAPPRSTSRTSRSEAGRRPRPSSPLRCAGPCWPTARPTTPAASPPWATWWPRPSGGRRAASAAGTAKIALVSPTALAADLLGTPGGYPATVTHQQVAQALAADAAGQHAAHRRPAQDRAGAAVAADLRRRGPAGRSCGSVPRPGSPGPTTRPARRARGSPACGSTGSAIAPAVSYSVTVSAVARRGW